MIDVEKIVAERMDADDAALPDQVAEIAREAVARAFEEEAAFLRSEFGYYQAANHVDVIASRYRLGGQPDES